MAEWPLRMTMVDKQAVIGLAQRRLALGLLVGLLVGLLAWYRGYDYGLRKGRAEHTQCHQAARALAPFLMAAAMLAQHRETEDIKAWEDEL